MPLIWSAMTLRRRLFYVLSPILCRPAILFRSRYVKDAVCRCAARFRCRKQNNPIVYPLRHVIGVGSPITSRSSVNFHLIEAIIRALLLAWTRWWTNSRRLFVHQLVQGNNITSNLSCSDSCMIWAAMTLVWRRLSHCVQADAHFSDPWIEYANSYCWIKNTYYLPQHEVIPREHEHWKRDTLTYYQWVPLILLIQALFYYLPCMAWRSLSDR